MTRSKVIGMWAFTFAVLAATTFATLKQATADPAIALAYTGTQPEYVLVFRTTVRERNQRFMLPFFVRRAYYEVCATDAGTVDALSRQLSARGRDKNGTTYIYVKRRYDEAARVYVDPSQCTTVLVPFWHLFIMPGGSVS